MHPLKFKSRVQPWPVLLFSLLLIVLIVWIDYYIGLEVHLSVLLLIPIYLVTWYTGFRNGILFSLLGAASLLMDPLFDRKVYTHLWVVFWNIVVLFVFFITLSYVLSVLQRTLKKTRELARKDDLTGLLNSRTFYEIAEQERLSSMRYGHPFTICFLDLDNFKKVNDTYGHVKGDELLRIVARILKEEARQSDLVARLGGDEFTILFPETGSEVVKTIITKLHEKIADEFKKSGWPVTTSIGVVTFHEIPGSVNDALHKVDQLMYAAKKAGKNQINSEVVGHRQ